MAFHGRITTHLMKVLPSSTVMFGTFGTFFSCHRRIAASTGMQLILALDNRANVMSNKEECVVVDESTARPPFHKITLRSGVLLGGNSLDLWHGRCFEERAKANLNGKRSRTMEGSYSRLQHTHVDSEGIAHGLFCTEFRGFVAGNLHWRSETAARRSLD